MPAPPEAPADATADALINATLEVVAERGLKGATTRLIAERAGVNEITLFRKYGNKMALIKAAVIARAGALRQEGVKYTGNLEHDLIHLTTEYGRVLANFGPFIRVMVTEFPRHPELGEILQSGPGQLFAEIGALLLRYQQEGKLRPEPIATLLPAFLGPVVLPYLVGDVGAVLLSSPLPTLAPQTHVERFLHGRATPEAL